MHSKGRTGALVVTAAAVLALGIASPALASTSGTGAQSTATPADLLPDASWHGRPIQEPDAAPMRLRRPVSLTAVIRQGAGLGQTGSSDVVRDIQRRLAALGYRPGPVDGAYGPRTDSAVAWFQIKHRLPATGAVDGTTRTLLNFRTHGPISAPAPASLPALAHRPGPKPVAPRPDVPSAAQAAPSAVAPRPEAEFAPAPHADAAPRPARAPKLPALVPQPDAAPVAPRPDAAAGPQAASQSQAAPRPDANRQSSGGLALPWLLLSLALAFVAVAAFVTWLRDGAQLPEAARLRKTLRRRARAMRVPARPSAPRRGRSVGTVAATNGNGHHALHRNGRQVIGYAVGRNERDFVRQQRAIERVCSERGWTLSALVKERDTGRGKRRRRPGRSHVLAQVAAGGVGQLVVGRLQSLAASSAELAVVLEWCQRREVGLLALDVGLDTTTDDGRVAARCLGAVGNWSARTAGAR